MRAYVLAQPDKERNKAHWELVAQTLMVGPASAGHTMLSEIAIRHALVGGKLEPERRSRKVRVS